MTSNTSRMAWIVLHAQTMLDNSNSRKDRRAVMDLTVATVAIQPINSLTTMEMEKVA